MARKLEVLLASNDALMGEGLRRILEAEFEITGIAADEESLFEQTAKGADVIVLDPPGESLSLLRKLRKEAPDVHLVLLNQPLDPEYSTAAFGAGASGYLLQGADPNELIFAVRAVAKDGVYVSSALTREILKRQLLPSPASPSPPAETGEKAIRVLIVDDHLVAREGLRAALLAEGGIDVVALAGNGREAVELTIKHRPDVVAMDLMMPEMDGIETTRAILARWPTARILIISSSQIPEKILAAVQAGARGYVSKQLGRGEYLKALRHVHRGELFIPDEIAHHELAPELTRREHEVVRLVAAGLENQQIAAQLYVSDITVRTHVRNVMEKLQVANRVELVLHALRSGLVSLDELTAISHHTDRQKQ